MSQGLIVRHQLEQWALVRGFRFEMFEHWGAVASRVVVEDSGGDVYEIFAAACPPSEVRAGVALVKRGSQKHRALRREREMFSHSEQVVPDQLAVALDACLARAQHWVVSAGHHLPGIRTGA